MKRTVRIVAIALAFLASVGAPAGALTGRTGARYCLRPSGAETVPQWPVVTLDVPCAAVVNMNAAHFASTGDLWTIQWAHILGISGGLGSPGVAVCIARCTAATLRQTGMPPSFAAYPVLDGRIHFCTWPNGIGAECRGLRVGQYAVIAWAALLKPEAEAILRSLHAEIPCAGCRGAFSA